MPSLPSRPPRQKPPEIAARAEGFRVIAGVDEAGRGPWAGPVVAAAVIVARRLRGVRIDDSKKLSPRQRERAYRAILDSASVGVGIVPAGEIDRRNIRQATLAAMQIAVDHLARRPDVVLVDGNDPPALPMACWPVVGGDARSYPIACASIIAKVTRDSLMRFYHQLFPEYGFDRHKGYGTALHLERLKIHGPSLLHRLSFHPVSGMASGHESVQRSSRMGDPAPSLV